MSGDCNASENAIASPGCPACPLQPTLVRGCGAESKRTESPPPRDMHNLKEHGTSNCRSCANHRRPTTSALWPLDSPRQTSPPPTDPYQQVSVQLSTARSAHTSMKGAASLDTGANSDDSKAKEAHAVRLGRLFREERHLRSAFLASYSKREDNHGQKRKRDDSSRQFRGELMAHGLL